MKKYVLVADDYEAQNKILCDIVKRAGYEPIEAFNGVEALEAIDTHKSFFGLKSDIECVLLDWSMPEMNGEDFLHELRKREREKIIKTHLPVVVITAHDSPQKRRSSVNQEWGKTTAYITKPFQEEEIAHILHQIIDKGENDLLVNINRKMYFMGVFDHKEEKKKGIQHEDTIRNAYFSGQINDDALEYIYSISQRAADDLEKALGYQKLTPESIEKLKAAADFYDKEYGRLLLEVAKLKHTY